VNERDFAVLADGFAARDDFGGSFFSLPLVVGHDADFGFVFAAAIEHEHGQAFGVQLCGR